MAYIDVYNASIDADFQCRCLVVIRALITSAVFQG